MKLHIIMHENFEVPAVIEEWAKNRNYQITYTKLYQNELLPNQVNNFDFLIVMGGPQSPATTITECSYFNVKKEIEFIRLAIDNNKAVLGVCLGAQLIGEALGAKFNHSPNREIGVFNITLTDAGKKDKFFSSLPKTFPVGHWHGDMPGLTDKSEVLAYSEGCPRQIIKYTLKVYGFQCHFEFTPESIKGMIENCSDELETYKELPYIQNASTLKNNNYSQFNEYLFMFLEYIEAIQKNEKFLNYSKIQLSNN